MSEVMLWRTYVQYVVTTVKLTFSPIHLCHRVFILFRINVYPFKMKYVIKDPRVMQLYVIALLKPMRIGPFPVRQFLEIPCQQIEQPYISGNFRV